MPKDDRPALGLEHRKVVLADPDDRWAELYRLEERRLRDALGAQALDIQHFGSTSIPGIKAKPVLDILLGVAALGEATVFSGTMLALGYDDVGTEVIPGDHLFGKSQPRTHLVHVVEHDGHHWVRNLRFRDALRADRSLALRYEALKVELAALYPDSRADYTEAKRAFIARIADGS
jgi:GrpB-like predicted nucleotidyltransferase (UPF0157 family)